MNYYNNGDMTEEGISCRGVVHCVRPGDTLYKISRIYGVSIDELMDVNENLNIYNLQIGDKICVPVSQDETEDQGRPYMVQEKDNLNSILALFNMTFDEFAKYNPQLMPIPLEERSIVFIPPDKILRDVDNQ